MRFGPRRPQFVVAECNMATHIEKGYVAAAGIEASKFSFVSSGFRNHNDQWILRPSIARASAHAWMRHARGLGPAPPPTPPLPQTPASLCKPGQTPPSCYCPTFCPGGCCGQPPVPKCAEETFRDDFDSPVLDTSKWTVLNQVHRGGVRHPELKSTYQPWCVVSAGVLTLSSGCRRCTHQTMCL